MQNRNPQVCAVVITMSAEASALQAVQGDLSAREREILTLASHGKTAPEMAAKLAITERTVAFHVNNLVEKLGASNKTHAVAQALRLGLIR
jgi:DNA-binding CsgD family transcriptional regulator